MFCKPGQSDDNGESNHGHDIMNMMITMMVTSQPGQSQMSVCPLWCPLSQWEAEMVANQDFAKAGIISTKTIIPTMRVSITVRFVTITKMDLCS